MRFTASLSARVPSVSPSWASSPAACTAVPTRSAPLGGEGGRLGGGGWLAARVALDGRTPAGLVRGAPARPPLAEAREAAAGLLRIASPFAPARGARWGFAAPAP